MKTKPQVSYALFGLSLLFLNAYPAFSTECKITDDHPAAKKFLALNEKFDAEIARAASLTPDGRYKSHYYSNSFLREFKSPLKELISKTRSLDGMKNIILALEKIKAEEADSLRWGFYRALAIQNGLKDAKADFSAAVRSEFCSTPTSPQAMACALKQADLYTALGKARGFLQTADKNSRGFEELRPSGMVREILQSIERKVDGSSGVTKNLAASETLLDVREKLRSEIKDTYRWRNYYAVDFRPVLERTETALRSVAAMEPCSLLSLNLDPNVIASMPSQSAPRSQAAGTSDHSGPKATLLERAKRLMSDIETAIGRAFE